MGSSSHFPVLLTNYQVEIIPELNCKMPLQQNGKTFTWADLFNNRELFQAVNRTVSVRPTQRVLDIPDTLVPWLALIAYLPTAFALGNHFQAKYIDFALAYTTYTLKLIFCHRAHHEHPISIKRQTQECFVFQNLSAFTPKQSLRVLICIFCKTSWDDGGNSIK